MKGTAEVVFARRIDALGAVKKYNNVLLDGKPMQIEIIGTIPTPTVVPQVSNGAIGIPNGASRRFALSFFLRCMPINCDYLYIKF